MANITQEKREKLLNFLEELKTQHSDDDSLRKISEIATALNEKKYGLVWEKHTEEVDEMLEHNIPVFKEVEERKIVSNKDEAYNFLLEGDNLHSLKLLEKTHKGKIDVIYIDPPYNTGNKDFIYNDKYVDKTDGYSHSKWLSFMSERLEIARELLSDDGVIFISIDDNEQAQLKLLCDEVFGEENLIGILPRITKKSGKDHGQNIAKNHDFLIIYSKNSIEIFQGIQVENTDYPFKDEFYDQRGGYKLNQTLDYNSLWYNPKMDFEINIDAETYYPGGNYDDYLQRHIGNHESKDWVWRWSLEKFNFGLRNGFIVIKKSKNGTRIYTKTYSNATISKKNGEYFVEIIERNKKLSSLFFVDNIYSNDNAKKDLAKVFASNNVFDFSKPVLLISNLIANHFNKNSTILDFFAGSGTTGHAVMQLNKEDGGNRKYILCTNNENNICEEVTYQRLKNIQEELPHNLKYFKTDFISKYESEEDEETISEKMLEHVKELIELEYHVEMDDMKYIVLDDEDEIEEVIERIEEDGKLFITEWVFLGREHKRKLEEKNVEVINIPEYYYRDELQELGEI